MVFFIYDWDKWNLNETFLGTWLKATETTVLIYHDGTNATPAARADITLLFGVHIQ